MKDGDPDVPDSSKNVEDVDSFVAWSTQETCGKFTERTKGWYDITQNNLFTAIQEHPWIANLPNIFEQAAGDYRASYGAALFELDKTPKVSWHKKSYGSFIEKMYRLNCVENDNFPSPPEDGWITLGNSYEKIDDVVRSTVIVAYADGPAYLAAEIRKNAESSSIDCSLRHHTKEKGYYAHHLYFHVRVHMLNLDTGLPMETVIPIELQITTQLQSSLREVTHHLYEKERLHGGPLSDWKSDFQSDRFRAAYMAHSLRFIEAMIIDLRRQVATKNGASHG